ncbi:MAG: ATP-dependent helicase, partial [Lachnospiraceae bacterium]|nr:ATP-dependent helicase [Lachnospiraceae bacterium]
MLHFKEYYPLAKQVILNVNYRCAGNILEVAAALIRENKNRFAKDPEAFREAGERVELIHTKERSEEYEILIRSIKEQMKQGISITDMAILYRKSADMEGMLRALDQAEIPYRKRELVKCLHQSFIAEDIRSYVRYITGDHSRQVFLKIMNKPFRYLYRDHLKAASYAPDNTLLRKFIIHDSKEQKRNMALEKLVRDVAVLKRMPPYLFCNYLRKGLGYDKYLADLSAMGQDKTQGQIKEKLREYKAELDQLMETMKDFRTLEEWLSFSQEEKDKAGEQKQVMVEQEGIRLITYHSSKGLEFDVVFLPDLNEGVVPHSKAIRPESLEEERRMLYVAMTRAKKKLYLLYADTAVVGTGDKGHRLLPSRFLSGLDQSSSSKSILSRYSSNASAAASYSASSSI